MKTRILTLWKNNPVSDLKVDEEKKVEAVRDFYAHAAENRVAFASAERMLFLGKFICFGLLVDLMMNFMMELMMGLMIGLMIDLMMDQMMDTMMDFWTSMDFWTFQHELESLSASLPSVASTGDTGSRCTWQAINCFIFFSKIL